MLHSKTGASALQGLRVLGFREQEAQEASRVVPAGKTLLELYWKKGSGTFYHR